MAPWCAVLLNKSQKEIIVLVADYKKLFPEHEMLWNVYVEQSSSFLYEGKSWWKSFSNPKKYVVGTRWTHWFLPGKRQNELLHLPESSIRLYRRLVPVYYD